MTLLILSGVNFAGGIASERRQPSAEPLGGPEGELCLPCGLRPDACPMPGIALRPAPNHNADRSHELGQYPLPLVLDGDADLFVGGRASPRLLRFDAASINFWEH